VRIFLVITAGQTDGLRGKRHEHLEARLREC
jgi:hypothetical protein